jgi:hypothetical protein
MFSVCKSSKNKKTAEKMTSVGKWACYGRNDRDASTSF